jgi:hypothetical protein
MQHLKRKINVMCNVVDSYPGSGAFLHPRDPDPVWICLDTRYGMFLGEIFFIIFRILVLLSQWNVTTTKTCSWTRKKQYKGTGRYNFASFFLCRIHAIQKSWHGVRYPLTVFDVLTWLFFLLSSVRQSAAAAVKRSEGPTADRRRRRVGRLRRSYSTGWSRIATVEIPARKSTCHTTNLHAFRHSSTKREKYESAVLWENFFLEC